MTAPGSVDAASNLSLEIERTRSVAEACAALLKFAVEECGLQRATAVVELGEQLRGMTQRGVGDAIERVAVDVDQIHPLLLEALRGARPADVPIDGRAAPGLEYPSYLVFPLLGAGDEPVGAVIADGDGFRRNRDRVARIFQHCGPALQRSVKLEEIEELHAEADRQRSLLAEMVNSLPDPVLLTDADHRIVISNRRANELFVSHQDDTGGRKRAVEVNNLFFTSHLTEAVVTGPDGERIPELSLVDPEFGSDLSFEVFTEPVSADEKLPGVRITVLRDITDLKRALAELEEQIPQAQAAEHRALRESSRLEAIIENVGEPILVTDHRSNIVRMNPEAERLFEAPQGASPSAEGTKAIRENDAKISGAMSEFLLRSERRMETKVDLRDPETGQALPVEVVSSKVYDRRGEVGTVVSVLRDLRPLVENERLARELRELNEQLEQRVEDATEELARQNRELEEQRRKLEKASKAKSDFLASVSHELRTPINAVLGYTSLMQERIYGELTDEQERALEKVRVASRQLLTLISEILDLSKIEAGRLTLSVEAFTLKAVVEELSETIEPLVRESELAFCKELPGARVALRTDRTKLQQILLNLLTNAVKFTDEGRVTLRAELAPDDVIRLEVEDTGIGIEEHELESIFEEFSQADRSRQEQRGGAGLGLAIAARLAELLGGTLEARSVVGRGSVFTLEIPRVVPPSARNRT